MKAFQEFLQHFQRPYKAFYPDPPQVSLEAVIERWKISQAKFCEQFDKICDNTKPQGKITKLFGKYSSSRLHKDCCMAVAAEKTRKSEKWNEFETIMTQYYKPTENITLKHFQFQSNLQKENETSLAFCNCVALEVKQFNFNCESPLCTAEETAVRDQIIIELKDNDICQEALKRSWHLE